MKVGYGRVSTAGDQTLDSQLDILKGEGCERIFTDTASGKNVDRAGLKEALAYLREGDELVVFRLDRLGRSVIDLINITNELNSRSIGFKSVAEGLDTTTAQGRFFFVVTAAFAEMERNIIISRTKAGLEAARSRGKRGGRPKAINQATYIIAKKLYLEQTVPVGEICSSLGINKGTFYSYLRKEKGLAGALAKAQDFP